MTELKRLRKPTVVKANTAVLEDLFLNADIEVESDPYESPQWPDVAVATLAMYGNDVLLSDILETEELTDSSDAGLVRIMIDLYALWVDKDAISNREDNLLTEPKMDKPEWRALFNYQMAKLVARKGRLVSLRASYYGWEDYTNTAKLPEIVALFNLVEDAWKEFDGTFNTDDDSHTGFTCDVMYADGKFRKLRYEGTLADIMRGTTELNS